MNQPDMYEQLRNLVRRYFKGELTYFQLRHIVQHYGHAFSPDHDRLWSTVMMHLALYGAGTWTEQELRTSLQEIEYGEECGKIVPFTVMLKDERFVELMRSGALPWPMKLKQGLLEELQEQEADLWHEL